ncbi:MAG: nucleoside phosphorylase [Clostridiaceae bacterium]|nr:nucleoside phosphorylase [Eubacteriales bacterium]NLV49039.1 nucleoside phosphorylase [Clostridiaceae bacterium]
MNCLESLNDKGQQYHIQCSKGDVGRYVLLPGDPFRTDLIAERFDHPVLVAHNREHKTWSGFLDGIKVSVTSTGMGCPSTAIAVEELVHCGADTFIRIGTAGRVSDESFDEALQGIIVTGSVRDEGTTRQYIPIEYPAIADRHIVAALADSAASHGYKYREGIVQCKDSYYGQIDPDGLPNGARLKERWQAWKNGNVMASEMETSALFVVSSIRRCRAGAVMSFQNMEQTITIAVDALRTLIKADTN